MNIRPFLGTEALASGAVSERSLLSQNDRIYRGVYMPTGADVTAATRAEAAWLWSGRQATAAGLSAAALHGTQWIDSHLPAELYRRNGRHRDPSGRAVCGRGWPRAWYPDGDSRANGV